METRKEQIIKRRSQIPIKYKKKYDRAVKGRSLRSAIDAQCMECVCWKFKEVQMCTDLACPLYGVRPYRSSPPPRDEGVNGVESEEKEN